MNIDLDTWIISDTHFGHDNIVKFCNRPIDHNEIMLKNWIDAVDSGDKILHLGDVGFGKKAEPFMFDLLGDKYLIKGNHDTKSDSYYEGFGFEIIEPFSIATDVLRLHSGGKGPPPQANAFVHFGHDPLSFPVHSSQSWNQKKFPWGDTGIHGHIHNNGYHPDCSEDIDYRNVSIEVMDYKPVRLRDILYGGKYQSRKNAGLNAFDVKRLAESNGNR